MCVCVWVWVWVWVCVRACGCGCVCVRVCVYVCLWCNVQVLIQVVESEREMREVFQQQQMSVFETIHEREERLKLEKQRKSVERR